MEEVNGWCGISAWIWGGVFGRAVEFGLMSMTTAKETAFAYSGVRHKRGIVFEIAAGRVDVGASIQFLSQYPGEAEYLTQPLCCLEVSAPGRG